MSSELKVPQVFEPGARVAAVDLSDLYWVVSRLAGTRWMAWAPSGEEVPLCEASDLPLYCIRVVAPAPREGQRWETTMPDVALRDVRLLAADAESPVATARWLLEHGYSYAGPADAAPATLRASEAAAVEPTPAPWTRAAARQIISKVIAVGSPRRPAAFTSAMCSMAERRIPSAELISSTARALHALEAALPEHGPVAPWVSERALDVAAACFPEHGWLELADGLDACRFYLARRAAR
jgi:hypothetical protein